jgi:hypothetical protein
VFTGREYKGSVSAGVVLTEDNVTSASVLIVDCDSSVVVDEGTMNWNADDLLWEYKWDTSGLPAGSYRYRITVIGADGNPSIEWGKTRLARQPSSGS